MNIVIFIVFATLILFGAHYFIYFTLAHFLVTGAGLKKWLAVDLAILSVSFIGSMFLVHWKENFLTKAIYYGSSVWIGVFVNVVLLLAIFWIVYFIFSWMKLAVRWNAVMSAALLIALLVSGWGMYNAYHPRIREHSLTIPMLPEQWRGKKIVQLSDLHLGLSNGHSFLEKVVSLTNAQQPDIIIITGDLFDGGDGNLEIFAEGLNRLQSSTGVYFITGNHETYLGLEEVDSVVAQTNIKKLDDQAITIDGIRLIGISYPQRGENKDLAGTIKNLSDDNYPQLLLFHAPTDLEAFSKAGIDAMFSGHTHRGQLFPFGFITSLIFDGYDRGLKTYSGMQVYVSSGTGTWGPPVKTSGRTEITVFRLQ